MKLSILIPMYNAKTYIGNCIESLLHQNISEDDYEIIIMDDGSTDNSVAIVQGYAKDHKQIKLHQQPNSGAYHTRNKLLALAKGTYIYNLDADDYLVHNSLKVLLDYVENHQPDILGFKTKETMNLDMTGPHASASEESLRSYSGHEFLEQFPLMRYEIWWYFIRRDYITDYNFVFNDNQYNADVLFTLNAFLNARNVAFCDGSIHRYVQTEGSIMRSKDHEVTRNRFAYMQKMILNTSRLINNLAAQKTSEVLVQNLKHRRDVFTFFNIIKMIREPFNRADVKQHIQSLKDVSAYPVGHFNRFRYNNLQYRILKTIINNESLVYVLVSLRALFSKPIK